MSSTYTEPRLALSLGGRSIGDAGDRVQRYCGLEAHGDREIWAYEFYDTIRSSPMAVEPVDVVIASGVHPGIARRHLQFFHEMSGELNAWLASIPEPAALQTASDALLDHLSLLADLAGAELSLVSKVLHRKRPDLIPLVDRHVLDWYRHHLPSRGSRQLDVFQALLAVLVSDLAENTVSIGAIRELVALAGVPEPSALRVIDIAIWMEGR